MIIIFSLFVIFLLIEVNFALTKVIDPYFFFCGSESCYDILELTRESSQADIKRSYRRLSLKYHPDKNQEMGAAERFKFISKAYEVLTDEKEDGLKQKFDYYLDHPREYYKVSGHYIIKDIPKSDVGMVIAGVVIFISMLMYSVQSQRYSTAIKYLKTATMNNTSLKNGGTKQTIELYKRAVEKYEAKVMEDKKKNGTKIKLMKMNKDPIFEAIVDELVAEVKIEGGYRKPQMNDIFAVWLLQSPYLLYVWAIKYYRRNYSSGSLSMEDKFEMAINKVGGLLWNTLDTSEQEKLIQSEIWKASVYNEWIAKRQAEEDAIFRKNNKGKSRSRGDRTVYEDSDED